jgi:Uma2 family endonuclease
MQPRSDLDDHLAPEQIRPLRRAEYGQLIDLGVFGDERLELLRGRLVRMSPQKSPHASTVSKLTRFFIEGLGDRAVVRIQLPLALTDDSEPEPDVAICAPGDYDAEHPATALLIVEVSDSDQVVDRKIKTALYAEAGIPEYWLMDLPRRQLERYRSPAADGYQQLEIVEEAGAVAPEGFPAVSLRIGDVLPRRR